MRRLRGRRLHLVPVSGQGDGFCYEDVCLLPLLPPAPAPAPAPPPISHSEPCPHFAAPSPAPVPTASWGRRDQGVNGGYGSPPGGGGGGHNRRPVTMALAAVAAIAFVALILLGVSVLVRRRQVRRRRQALLAAPAADPAAPTDADDPEGGGGGGGGVVHHIWYIRTVGLDEAAIDSIAATQYRAGAGLLGAADCTVCLGEFQDGELVRLLPKCGHAFHVPCIDTWLRAHVNCPLCRSDVLDPAVTTDTGGGGESSTTTPPADPVEDGDTAAAAGQADATSEAVAEHEQNEDNHRGSSLSAEENQHEQSSLPEPVPQLPRPLPHNVRRAASMDAATVSTAADVAAALHLLPEAAPEEEQSGRRKRGTTTFSVQRSNLGADRSAATGIPRSFFSRHSRARSSVSPL